MQASKVNTALNVERQQARGATLEATKATLSQNRQALAQLEDQQAALHSAADGLETDLQTQVLNPCPRQHC